MNTLLLMLLLGANPLFVEQPLTDLEIGAINPLTGTYATNFRHHDMNQDQLDDLVFVDHIRLQQNGLYPETATIPLPNIPEANQIDLFDGKLYYKQNRKIRIFELQKSEWLELPNINTPWETNYLSETTQSKNWGSFLVDINADNAPEAIHTHVKTLDILSWSNGEQPELRQLSVFPAARLTENPSIWGGELRTPYASPAFSLSFRCYFDAQSMSILQQIPFADGMQRFTAHTYQISRDSSQLEAETITAPLPSYLRPCRLNTDSQLDFAGGELQYRSTTALLAPVYKFGYTTDAGKTIHYLQTKSFLPHTNLMDYNGDGLKDILMEETFLGEGGMRQTVSRLTTQRKIEHAIHIHQQQKDGTFPNTPTLTKRFTIKLDRFPITNSTMFQRYQNGYLVNTVGNLNGDDFLDLVVQAAPSRLDIYLGGITGFRNLPDIRFDIDPEARFHVLDIDNDGLDDIVTSHLSAQQTQEFPATTVHFTKSSIGLKP